MYLIALYNTLVVPEGSTSYLLVYLIALYNTLVVPEGIL